MALIYISDHIYLPNYLFSLCKNSKSEKYLSPMFLILSLPLFLPHLLCISSVPNTLLRHLQVTHHLVGEIHAKVTELNWTVQG